jgi:hypothetical protein
MSDTLSNKIKSQAYQEQEMVNTKVLNVLLFHRLQCNLLHIAKFPEI